MLIRFWGTRGSLPVGLTAEIVASKIRRALRAAAGRHLVGDEAIDRFIGELDFPVKHTYGGNSPCVEIEPGSHEHVLCDLGSGVRAFSQRLLEKHGPKPQVFHVFQSHVHWDHIMGFPFFTHAYIPGNKIRIYGCHDVIEKALRQQHSAPCFPVSFDMLGADIEFVRLEPERTVEVLGMSVTPKLQPHSGDSYGYRFEKNGRSMVYSTDAEHKLESPEDTEAFVEFFRNADLVIFDAMYSLADAVSVKEDWGHSSNIVGVDLCLRAKAKHYCMFHHEPVYNDDMIHKVLQETIRYEQIMRDDHALKISSAFDGMEIRL